MFLEITVYVISEIEGLALLFDDALFSLKSSIQFSWGKNTLHGYSQSNYHQIYLADIHGSY